MNSSFSRMAVICNSLSYTYYDCPAGMCHCGNIFIIELLSIIILLSVTVVDQDHGLSSLLEMWNFMSKHFRKICSCLKKHCFIEN